MAKKKQYPLGAFMKEFSSNAKYLGSIWQNCGDRKVLSDQNEAAVTLVCCSLFDINAPSAITKSQ